MLELLKEAKTVAQLTSEYGVHATVLRDWKQAALKGLPDVFERRDSLTDVMATEVVVLSKKTVPRSKEIWLCKPVARNTRRKTS